MIHKKLLLILLAVILSAVAKVASHDFNQNVSTSGRFARKVDPIKDAKELIKNVDFDKLFKKIRRNHSPNEMRIVNTLGLLSGALKVEKIMRENVHNLTDKLLDSFDKSTPKENILKLIAIEEAIVRDKSTIAILNGMLQYAGNATTLHDLQKDMQHILRENEASSKRLHSKKLAVNRDSDESDGQKNAPTGKLLSRSGMSLKYNIKERLYDVREMIDNHVENIHSSVTDNVKQTIKYVQRVQRSNQQLMNSNAKRKVKLDPSLMAVRRLWDQVDSSEHLDTDFDATLNDRKRQLKSEKPRLTKGERLAAEMKTSRLKTGNDESKSNRSKRQNKRAKNSKVMVARQDEDAKDDDDDNKIDNSKDDKSNEGEIEIQISEQDDDDYEESSSEEPGGLVGLITNLSGGDDGSDINAIIGALSQVVQNLLGPGGIDVPGVVGSGSALLASLIGGDENFGKVLGNIFGLAVDGFSGGGAVENGLFFGQFLGKFISVLSANPDDENAPLQPDSFIVSLYDGIGKGSAKAEEPKERANRNDDDDDRDDKGGSDSSSFIEAIVSGIVHVITKASAGSSAGSSQGSAQGVAGLSSGSSSGLSGGSLKSK